MACVHACARENKQNVAARWHCPRLACKHVAHGMFMFEWIASVDSMQCSGRAVISQLRWLAPSASTLLARLRAVMKVTRHSCFCWDVLMGNQACFFRSCGQGFITLSLCSWELNSSPRPQDLPTAFSAYRYSWQWGARENV